MYTYCHTLSLHDALPILKVTLMASFVVALPVVLYQAWAFVAPGLYRHEKRLALPLIVSSTLLFILGMAFCYFFVFRTVFHFIATFAPQSITPAPDIEAYLSFVMTMFMAFCLTFEVPVAVVLLGTASRRERVCRHVWISVLAV